MYGANVHHLQGVPPGTQEAEGLPRPDRRVGEECLTNRDGAAAILVVLRLQTEDVLSLAPVPEGEAVERSRRNSSVHLPRVPKSVSARFLCHSHSAQSHKINFFVFL